MKKTLRLFFLTICCAISYTGFAQGKFRQVADPAVQSMEDNRKTTAPFSVLFKDDVPYKTKDAQLLFNKYLGLKMQTDELRYLKNDDNGDITTARYQQYFKGVKVEHGNYIITAKKDKVSFITGDFYTIDPSTNITPQLKETEALDKALNYMHATKYKWQIPEEEAFIKKETGDPSATYYPKGELVMVENFADDGKLNGKVMLAYKFDIYAQEPINRAYIYIDAVTGKMLLGDAVIKHHSSQAKEKTTTTIPFYLNRTSLPASAKNTSEFASPTVTGTAATRYSGSVTIATRLVGGNYNLIASIAVENYPLHTRNMNLGTKYAAATEFTDADNNWTAAEFNNATFDNAALDAHWGAAKVYDYWKTRHGRSSYNNAGAVINSYVHIKDSDPTNPDPTKYDNAYWDGTEMNYGDGSQVNGGFLPLTALDVCGHEIGHAVCSNTANLTYNRESGAMNEGFSDIWGCSIEHFSDPHEVDAVAKSYWDIGEEIGLPLPTALRSMANPKLYGQPDTYLGTNWQDATTAGCPTPAQNTNDYCGVHTNSGVLNHWFYLVVTGGSGVNDIGNGFSVPGIDWAEAELITFLAEKNLTSSANYAACRTATINAATTLYGACGLETEAVTRAWYGVGVGADFVPCTPQISFAGTATVVSETAAAPGCGASKTISIPLKISAAATGGNATATVNISSGSATNGVDYTLNNSTVTFAANSAGNQNIVLTIYDDGNIEPTENIVVHLATVAANGSNATKANVFLDYTVSITDDDKAEDNGGNETHILGTAPYSTSNLTSPFRSDSKRGRSQFIITAAELAGFGVRPNVPITNLSVFVATKNSTLPFTNFTISMANTASADVTSSFITEALTQVYTGNYSTVAGINNFVLSPTFTWDGTSNVAIQTCFGNSAAGTANDQVAGYSWQYSAAPTAPAYSTTGAAGGGCTLAFVTLNTVTRPVFTLIQSVTPTAIESTLSTTRDWTVNEANSTVNFYATADGKLIAKVKNNSAPLGCVNAQLVDAGNTWQSFLGGSRSQKAIKITPTTNIASTAYNVTLYYSTAEMGGKNPATVNLCKTTAATIAGATGTNTVIVTPTLITNSDGSWYSFSGDFTGFSTFFLVTQAVLPVNLVDFTATKNADDNITIKWNVKQQLNLKNYIIERSTDGISFKAIGTVSANSLNSTNYSFVDLLPSSGVNYYRLRITNANESFSYSKIANVSLPAKAKLWISPNPVSGIFTIHFNNATTVKQIYITDAAGKIIKEIKPGISNGSININASAFAKGMYFIKMIDADNNFTTQKIIKQ